MSHIAQLNPLRRFFRKNGKFMRWKFMKECKAKAKEAGLKISFVDEKNRPIRP